MSSQRPPKPPLEEAPGEPLPPDLLATVEILRPVTQRVVERIERGEAPPSCTLPKFKAGYPKALFLDSNRWIELGRAHYAKPEGEPFLPALAAIRQSVARGRLVVPMTEVNASEGAKSADISRRRRLLEFMVGLSGNFSALPSPELEDLEIDDAICKLYYETEPQRLARPSLVRYGTRTLYSTKMPRPQNDDPRVVRFVLECQMEPEVSVNLLLKSGTDRRLRSEMKALAERGRDIQVGIRRLDANLPAKEKLRRERRGLVTRGNEGKDWFLDQLETRLRANLVPVPGFHRWIQSDDVLAAFMNELPSFVVPATLAFARDRNKDARNDPNDEVDLSFMRVALPYGNIVVAENLWSQLANAEKLDQRYQTTVISDLRRLPSLLEREGC